MSKFFVWLAVLSLLGGCAHRNTGRDTSTAQTATRSEALTGGYSQPREPDREEIALFRKAVEGSDSVNYMPLSVSTQIVAGTNYRFTCRATDTDSDSAYRVEITVFRPLPGKGEPKVTSIERL